MRADEQVEQDPNRPLTRRELALELCCPSAWRSWRAPLEPLPAEVAQRIIDWAWRKP